MELIQRLKSWIYNLFSLFDNLIKELANEFQFSFNKNMNLEMIFLFQLFDFWMNESRTEQFIKKADGRFENHLIIQILDRKFEYKERNNICADSKLWNKNSQASFII